MYCLLCDMFRAAIELRREVAVHSRLRHSNVIQLMAVVFEYGHYGVLLEYATHADLRHFIRRFTPVCNERSISQSIHSYFIFSQCGTHIYLKFESYNLQSKNSPVSVFVCLVTTRISEELGTTFSGNFLSKL